MAPFRFRRRNKSSVSGDSFAPPSISNASSQSAAYEPYFGEKQKSSRTGKRSAKTREGLSLRENGEQLLMSFIRNRLGHQAESLAIRLMNKNPIKDGSVFTYVVNQSTEESDLQIICRDLLSGRLYRSGTKYIAPLWANLLFGDKFSTATKNKQMHELTYARTSCTCLACLVNIARVESAAKPTNEDDTKSISSTASSYVPENSAMANFVRPYPVPSVKDLKKIGGLASWRELEIGTIIRLNSRSAAKLKFTDDMRQLFSHLSYSGPISHEAVYRKVTTIGVNYYLYNKGKKERKVYLQGDMVQVPLEMGIVKLGTSPLYLGEVGAYHILYKRQVMKIYVGELVLEGNSFGSFIPTGIKYFIGIGEDGGCCPVYGDKSLGKPRRLGVNELLLHHHMVDDLKIRVK